MNSAKAKKLQYLIINQLLEEGSVQLVLPDGVKLDIGILQEDRYGNLKKSDDYCYVVASRDGKSAMIDSYNMGLSFDSSDDTFLYEDEYKDFEGKSTKTFDVF